jgi:NAD(P)-dependent dehydrogenase (short-subunit alcohol dehydrogenase family)
MGKLSGKVAVITGGNSGIGLETARLFVKEGAKVVITGRRQKELDEAVKTIGDNVIGVQGDVSNLADLDRLYAKVKEAHGHVDIVFANAGISAAARLGQITEEHFDRIFNINVKGLLFTVQKALPLMPNGGSIVLTSSVTGFMGFETFSVYSATKAAVRSFARCWTNDLKERKIRVNVVSPGPIETPIFGKMGFSHAEQKGFGDLILSLSPMGRMGKPEEIAKAALFLASEDSTYVTGIELSVDGGLAQV